LLLALSVISHQSHRLGTSSYRIFDEQGGSIGRGQNNEWILDDPTCQLSSRHLNVRLGEGCFVVEDTSSNGTGLNGRDALLPRGQRVPIADGDRLFLSDFEILVQVVEHVAPPGNPREMVRGDAPRAPLYPGASDATLFGDSATNANRAGEMAPLYAALGLPPQAANEASTAQVASVLKVVIRGVIDLLDARQQMATRYPTAVGHPEHEIDNPLMLQVSIETALQDLFGKHDAGSLNPVEAFRRALDSLVQHQAAMLAGLLAVSQQRQVADSFARAYHDRIRQLNDATRIDNP
jgi:predicted component of type VI protein secretion system